MDIAQQIAQELQVKPQQITAAVDLLDEGATVPFIARYRKEVTQGLDDGQLRELETRLGYLRELQARKEVILRSIDEQKKLTPELKKDILDSISKTRLEDLYRPYKPKRRTKAQIAKEAGIGPFAELLLKDPHTEPELTAKNYINTDKGFADEKAVLDGARQILMESFAEDAGLIGQLRDYIWDNGFLSVSVMTGKEEEGEKFKDYFAYEEAVKKIPSHRMLAVLRGRSEGILMANIKIDDTNYCEHKIARRFNIEDKNRPADNWLLETVSWTFKIKIMTHLELDLFTKLRQAAEQEAILVFSKNLHDLLLAAPAGAKTTLGLDPGFRTGVKVVVVDKTGKLLVHDTIYPHPPQNKWDEAISSLAKHCKNHDVNLVSIGNGTASRETDKLVKTLMQRHPELKLTKLVVSEAGASVYSASEFAAKEFPSLDVSLRGAVSIARRLQDPLAELVKIDPKAIGVGQYQHDVNQVQLARSLKNVVEDCVNGVGVNLNSASVALLTYVSGLNETTAQNIVDYRDSNGAFKNRKALKKVPRLGDKSFEQAAGFLKITDGDNPLDASAVHPEAYPVIEKILSKSNKSINQLIGNKDVLRRLNPKDFTDEQFGLPTVQDILKELEKPGRDPRPEFKTAEFREGVETLSDLKEGMSLEGVISNVTNFGAFVDIGVHQDGLVHISQLADQYVADPKDVVKAGDIVKVRVLEVDVKRKRISLTMRK